MPLMCHEPGFVTRPVGSWRFSRQRRRSDVIRVFPFSHEYARHACGWTLKKSGSTTVDVDVHAIHLFCLSVDPSLRSDSSRGTSCLKLETSPVFVACN